MINWSSGIADWNCLLTSRSSMDTGSFMAIMVQVAIIPKIGHARTDSKCLVKSCVFQGWWWFYQSMAGFSQHRSCFCHYNQSWQFHSCTAPNIRTMNSSAFSLHNGSWPLPIAGYCLVRVHVNDHKPNAFSLRKHASMAQAMRSLVGSCHWAPRPCGQLLIISS